MGYSKAHAPWARQLPPASQRQANSVRGMSKDMDGVDGKVPGPAERQVHDARHVLKLDDVDFQLGPGILCSGFGRPLVS